jgi:hypothetical protein
MMPGNVMLGATQHKTHKPKLPALRQLRREVPRPRREKLSITVK